MRRRLGVELAAVLGLGCILFMFPVSASADVTVADLPLLQGEVFAGTLADNDLVVILVFLEAINGTTYYTEYTFDPATSKLKEHASSIAEIIQPRSEWKVYGKLEPDPQDSVYIVDASGVLKVDGLPTGLGKVDYEDPSAPVLTAAPGGCFTACVFEGCCVCCYCVHRALNIPYFMDRLCCRWAGLHC